MAGVVGLINSRPSSLNLWRISSYRRFWEKYRNTWVLERASVSKKSQWAFLSAAAKNKINTHITPEQRETNAWSSRARPPVIGCSPHICLNVYMFECLYVHTFWEGCKYWILDIEWQTLRCTKIRRTKNNLSSKINFPVTSTTGSKPSLTSYYWTQSLRHFWGGSINNISELDIHNSCHQQGPFPQHSCKRREN